MEEVEMEVEMEVGLRWGACRAGWRWWVVDGKLGQLGQQVTMAGGDLMARDGTRWHEMARDGTRWSWGDGAYCCRSHVASCVSTSFPPRSIGSALVGGRADAKRLMALAKSGVWSVMRSSPLASSGRRLLERGSKRRA